MSEESPDYGPLGDYAAQIDAAEYFGGEELHPISSGRILAIKALGASMFDPTMDEIAQVVSRQTYPKAATDAIILVWALSQPAPIDESGKRQPSQLSKAAMFPDMVFESVLDWAENVAEIMPGQKHHGEAMKVFTQVFLDHWGAGYEDAEQSDPLKPEGAEDEEGPGKAISEWKRYEVSASRATGRPTDYVRWHTPFKRGVDAIWARLELGGTKVVRAGYKQRRMNKILGRC